MNKNYVFLVAACILIVTISLGLNFIIRNNGVSDNPPSINNSKKTSYNQESYRAKFKIITLGTIRTFDEPMYKNLSDRAYIDSDNSEEVIVNDVSTTWGDFFQTLPFRLTKECLITGTGQTFCETEKNKLKFILNNIENPDALDQKIMENDYLLIQYGKN